MDTADPERPALALARRRPALTIALALSAISLLFALDGCRSRAPASHSSNVSPAPQLGTPRFADPATGAALSTTTLTLDFGRVRLWTEARRDVHLRNDGPIAFTVAAFRPSDGFPAAFTYSAAPINVGPGEDVALAVAFRPTDVAGVMTGSLELAIENGDPNALTLVLSGIAYRGYSPELEYEPSQLDFGDVELTTSWTARLTVANVGVDVPGTTADNLRFAVLGPEGSWVDAPPSITGPDAADFGLEWPPAGYSPEGLAEGETVDLRVRFYPRSQVGDKAATLVIATNDPARPRVEVRLAGSAAPVTPCELEADPSSLEFDCDFDGSITRTLSIRNPSAHSPHDCQITSLDLTADSQVDGVFSLVEGPLSEPRTIPAGTSLDVPVRFAPRAIGSFTGAIAFTAQGSTPSSPHTVQLHGRARGCLTIAPIMLDFGGAGVGCPTRSRTITLYNSCPAPVSVEAIDMRAGPTSGAFTITQAPSLPSGIATGGQTDFRVTYRPIRLGQDAATIAITLAGQPGAYEVALTGTGRENPPQVDGFSNSRRPKVDFLFVVDNSSSMADKQASLTTNFDSFIQYLLQQAPDYHIAVTTTDLTATGEAGRFVPLTASNPRVITPATANKQQVFEQNVAVGTSGSETESLLMPVYLALTNPLVSGDNAGFFRSDAKLGVVIISDAADQDPSTNDVTFYEDFLYQLKANKTWSNFSVAAVVPTQPQAPAGCTYDTATAGQDLRVKQLVQRTGGFIADICDSNWAGTTLNRLGERLYGLRTRYYLSNWPDMTVAPDPIIVEIDGVRFDQYDPAHGLKRWDYNPSFNALDFDELAVPDYGSILKVTYYVSCL